MDTSSGLWIYSDDALEILIPDSPPGELLDLGRQYPKWMALVGNNTDQPITLNKLITNLPPNTLSIWRYVEKKWEVYIHAASEQTDLC